MNSFDIIEIKKQNDLINDDVVSITRNAENVLDILKMLSSGYKSSAATPLIKELESKIEKLKERNTEIHKQQNEAITQSEYEINKALGNISEALNNK